MFTNLIIYCLSIYFFFHLFGRSDIAAPLRCGLKKILPSGLIYIGQCAFCFTFWVGLVASVIVSFFAGILVIPYFLLAAPVLNLVLDLTVKALLIANTTSFTVSTTGLGQSMTTGELNIGLLDAKIKDTVKEVIKNEVRRGGSLNSK